MKVSTFFRIAVLFVAAPAIAQPGDPHDPDTVPIGGIEILLVLGSLFGIKNVVGFTKKLKDRN